MPDSRVFIVKNSSLGTASFPYVVPSRNGRTGTTYGTRLIDVLGFPAQLNLAHNNAVYSGTWTGDNVEFLFTGGTLQTFNTIYKSFSLPYSASAPSNTSVPMNATYGEGALCLPMSNTLEGSGLTSGNYYVQPVTAWTEIASDTETQNPVEMRHVIYPNAPVVVSYTGTFTAKLYRRVSITAGQMTWIHRMPIMREVLGTWYFQIQLEHKIVCHGNLVRNGTPPSWVIDPADPESTPVSLTFDYVMKKNAGYTDWSPKGNYVYSSGSTGNANITTNTGNLVIS